VAIHPIEFNEDAQSIDTLKQELTTLIELSSTKIVAIGETGLDYFHVQREVGITEEKKQGIITRQQSSLRMHIQLAQRYQLPLILHVRDQSEQAYWDTLQLLEEEDYKGKCILHCVSGPATYVQKALEMGAYVSVAGNVSYKNAEHIRELVRLVPADRLLIETDAPYLPPQQLRGQVCEPWMISLTAQYLQDELHISVEKTHQNGDAVFQLQLQ
jgi:TatD DNase family protein